MEQVKSGAGTERFESPDGWTSVPGFTWDVDGTEVVVVQRSDLRGTTADHVGTLMEVLECSELEAWHALRIIREDGEFVTSVSSDIEDLPLSVA